MEIVAAVAAWGASSACRVPSIGQFLGCGAAQNIARRDIHALQQRLSQHAKVYFPETEGFEGVSARWSVLDAPRVDVVIVPATHDDVAETVKFANDVEVPFLAYGGAHGAVTTLGRMRQGIEINLGHINSVTISDDGATARIEGGACVKDVVDALWAAGKETVLGTCECVGFVGSALGGGHGWLQGHHGLIADQFVSMDIVLADGSLTTIDEKSDLWWAMNGAGHNFGIVTSVTTKIYDVEHTDWAIETLIFSGDKVKQVYDAANEHLLRNGTQPADVINWSYWLNNPDADPDKPVIVFYIIQQGVKSVHPTFTKPFKDIGPLSVQSDVGDFRNLAAWTGISKDAPPCQKAGLSNPRWPLYLQSYNPAAQEMAFELFASGTRDPAFANSLFMFEGYPTQGLRSVRGDASAFAFRDEHLLVAPLISYVPDGPERDRRANELGGELRRILHESSGREDMKVYVNYAFGDETQNAWYGQEDWRLKRLSALKHKYDPHAKFSFFAPIKGTP